MRILKVVIVVAVVAAFGAWWIAGQRELGELRESNEALTRQLADATAAANPVQAQAQEPAASGELTEDQLSELLRLRGRIQPLRRQVTDLSNRIASATSR